MRRILIDNARRKKSFKRGGAHQRIELDEAILPNDKSSQADKLIALDEALQKLAQKDKVKADLVKLRYFAGLTSEQTAKALGISHATAERYWDYARSWLRLEISKANRTAQG